MHEFLQAWKDLAAIMSNPVWYGMIILLVPEIIASTILLLRKQYPAICTILLMAATAKILSFLTVLTIEYLSRSRMWSGGDPGFEGLAITAVWFLIWLISSLVSLMTFITLLINTMRRLRPMA
jgi:hypothetical protein